jgi:3-phosphoglycerate kinase
MALERFKMAHNHQKVLRALKRVFFNGPVGRSQKTRLAKGVESIVSFLSYPKSILFYPKQGQSH